MPRLAYRRLALAAKTNDFISDGTNLVQARSTLLIPPPSTMTSGSEYSRHEIILSPAAAHNGNASSAYGVLRVDQLNNLIAF